MIDGIGHEHSDSRLLSQTCLRWLQTAGLGQIGPFSPRLPAASRPKADTYRCFHVSTSHNFMSPSAPLTHTLPFPVVFWLLPINPLGHGNNVRALIRRERERERDWKREIILIKTKRSTRGNKKYTMRPIKGDLVFIRSCVRWEESRRDGRGGEQDWETGRSKTET